MIRSHIFNGRRYQIHTEAIDGICDDPKTKKLELHVFANLGTKKGLRVAIHEALHAENGNLTEDTVDRISNEIGSFLWRLGYRYDGTLNE